VHTALPWADEISQPARQIGQNGACSRLPGRDGSGQQLLIGNVSAMSSWRFPGALIFSAVLCLAVAIVNRDVYPPNPWGIDFNAPRTGWTAYAPVDTAVPPRGRFDSFQLWDPYLWFGAAIALLLVAGCVLGMSARRRRA
jgi:hypothetical protein